jgi:hypothetical protein
MTNSPLSEKPFSKRYSRDFVSRLDAKSFQEGIMTAVLLDDIDVAPAPPLALAPAPATRRVRRAPIDTGGDPMVDATTRLLSIPLRHMYAALWRIGLIEVR